MGNTILPRHKLFFCRFLFIFFYEFQIFTRIMPIIQDNNPEQYMTKNGYTFGKTLGEGSYAKVRVVTCPNNKPTAACKMICKKKAPKDFVDRFLPRELDVLKKINHENVVSSSDIFEFPSKVFIIMEIADNGDLLDYIKKQGKRPDAESKRLFGDIAHGMEYLHGQEIVHRDLKCENLFLFKNYKVKIGDFGFARMCVDDRGNKILSQTYCGSAAYAAPEILKGTKYAPRPTTCGAAASFFSSSFAGLCHLMTPIFE